MVNFGLAMVLQQSGDLAGAIAQAHRTLEISRHFPYAYNILVPSNFVAGNLEEALRAQAEADQVKPRSPDGITELPRAMIYARMGRMDEARELMNRYQALRKPGGAIPETIARTWIALGDYDAAFAELTRGVEQHSGTVIFLKSSPVLEPLRSDPRYRELLVRMGNP
jgi:Flp pilus assembly protein TadD